MNRFAFALVVWLGLALVLDGALQAQNTPHYYLNDVASVVLPGSRLVVSYSEYYQSGETGHTATLYRLPESVHVAWASKNRYYLSDADFATLPVAARVTFDLKPADSDAHRFTGSADFGVLPVGEYVVLTRSARYPQYATTAIYNVGTLGSVWHSARSSFVAYAVDLRTMRHRDDVRYAVSDATHRDALVSIGGLSWAHRDYAAGAVVTGRASDGSVTVQRIWGDSGQSTGAGYIQTDRPVYRTGQHVYLRAVLRTGFLANYGIPTGKRRVLVRSGDGTTLYDAVRPVSKFGTVKADFDIPQGARLGSYQISIGGVSTWLSVEQYKKPEYVVSAAPRKKYVIGGDDALFDLRAKYLFGRPAAGMTLHYTARVAPYFYPFYNPYAFIGRPGWRFQDSPSFEATGTADDAGALSVAVPTKYAEFERTLQFQVDGRDASGRTASTQAQTMIVPASFRIVLNPDRWFATMGEDVRVVVRTEDYDAHARANKLVSVKIEGTRYDYRSHREEKLPAQTESLTTDGQGRAELQWRPQTAASYSLTFESRDERAHTVRSSLSYWVSSSREPWWFPNQNITLIPDKEKYSPGERPKLLLTVPQADADAVLLVSDDRLESARVLHVGAKPQTLTIDPPKNAANFTVHVEIPGKDGLQEAQASIVVDPSPPQLTVRVTPDKAKYAPGERASLRVHVSDRSGRGVRAELALGVVDESIYAVQEENRGTLLSALYANRTTFVASRPSWQVVSQLAPAPTPAPSAAAMPLKEIGRATSSRASVVASGTTADIYSVAGVPTRSFFPDTAFWKPDVVTNAAGDAVVTFTWPDSLTTWRATGVAVTRATQAGQGVGTTLVTKDFLVRLEMPRFLRRGDRSQFTAIVNGRAGTRSALVRLQAGDLVRGAAGEQTVSLDRNATGSAVWNVSPLTSLGVREIALQGGDGTLTDGVRLPIPIEAAGAAEHVRDAAEVHDRAATSFALPNLYDAGGLRITLAPSVVASLIQNVRLLDVYPYYCTEQTMSAALPAVFLDRVFKRTGVAPPADSPPAAAIVKKAVARLAELQHADGSWGWWEADPAHPFMTAYALYGLAEFRKAGYPVPATMLDRGIGSLLVQLKSDNDDTLRLWGGRQPNSQWNTRAFMLFALADAAPARMDASALNETMQHEGDLNDYARAVLGLAQHELGNDAAARALLAKLNAHMTENGSYAFWLGQTWHYAWQDDPIETTAYALRLNNALEPGSARVKKIVNFLRTQQRGNWWYTTKDTAAAVYAIAESVPAGSAEFHPDETVGVYVDAKQVGSLHVTKPVLTETEATIDVPAAELEHGGALRIETSGPGMLYWATDWTRYAPPYARKVFDAEESILARLNARPSSFSIERRYSAKRTPWQVGDEIDVDVTVRADADTDYVAVEDPFPAGAEYQPLQGQAADNWSGLQFFDDRAVFFADHLYASWPLHLRYALRVTTPGTYTAAPPVAYAMYGPPVSAVGQPDSVSVR